MIKAAHPADQWVPTGAGLVHHLLTFVRRWCPDRAQWRIERFALASGIDPAEKVLCSSNPQSWSPDRAQSRRGCFAFASGGDPGLVHRPSLLIAGEGCRAALVDPANTLRQD